MNESFRKWEVTPRAKTLEEKRNHFKMLDEMASTSTQLEQVVEIQPRHTIYRFFFTQYEWTQSEIPEDTKVIETVQEMESILTSVGEFLNELHINLYCHPESTGHSIQNKRFSEYFIFATMTENVGSNLRTLHLNNFQFLPIIFEFFCSPIFDQITDLHLEFTVFSAVNVKTKFPNLKALTLIGKWKLIRFTNWLNLIELTLSGGLTGSEEPRYWNNVLYDIGMHMPNLRKLFMLDESFLVLHGKYVNDLFKLTQLKELQIAVSIPQSFGYLLEMIQLTRLIVMMMDHLSLFHSEFPIHLKKLEYLEVKQISDSNTIHLYDAVALNEIRRTSKCKCKEFLI